MLYALVFLAKSIFPDFIPSSLIFAVTIFKGILDCFYMFRPFQPIPIIVYRKELMGIMASSATNRFSIFLNGAVFAFNLSAIRKIYGPRNSIKLCTFYCHIEHEVA